MPKLSILDALQRRWKRSVQLNVLDSVSVLDFREGEQIVITYTSATDKMKVFSAFMREGLESDDAVFYVYPDEESGTVRANLKKHRIDVEKHERNGTLYLHSLTEFFKPNGKLDPYNAVTDSLDWWTKLRDNGYNHIRDLEDFGDFSFAEEQWQKWIADYWSDPRWDDWVNPGWNDPKVSEWAVSKKPVGVIYIPSVMSVSAVNIESMEKKQVDELLNALQRTTHVERRFFIDLIEDKDSFSGSIGLDHERMSGRKILLEYDPVSNYEFVVDCLARESRANVQPIYVLTCRTSPIYTQLSGRPGIKFILTSISTSSKESTSEGEVLLPVKNAPLILEAISDVLKIYANANTNICFVFDVLSELLTTVGPEKTLIFLRHALDMFPSERVTVLFLLNASTNDPKVVSRIRGLFPNLLTYNKDGTKVVKLLDSQPA